MSSRFRALRFGFLEGLILVCAAGGAVMLSVPWRDSREQIDREARALETLRRVADAEDAYRLRGGRDTNRDGVPEFGYLEDLAAAHALSGAGLPSLDADGSALFGGYRFEVLLPASTVSGGRVALSRSGGRPDPVLSERSYVVTAIPDAEEGSGLRSFYLDQSRRLYIADGASDPESRARMSPPPLALLGPADASLRDQPIWRLAEKPPEVSSEKPPTK